MDVVKVDKQELLDKLRENRQNHIDTYDQVMNAYREKAIELLNEHIDRIENGSIEVVRVVLPAPENYEEEYNRTIAMVEWHQSETVELDEFEFSRYVLDNWTWKQEFMKMSQTYMGG